jgi:propionyl-CoA carboxylase alpha chain
VQSGSEISIYYDPMIAKVIAHAPTRLEAARSLARALREAEIDGLRTNRDFLVRLLQDPRFLAGEVDTRYLDREESAGLRASLLDDQDVRACAAAAALAAQAGRRADAPVQATLPSGWRNNASQDQRAEFSYDDRTVVVTYRFSRGELVSLSVDDVALGPVRSASVDEVVLELDGVARRYRLRSDGEHVHVSCAAGQCDLRELPRYPNPEAQRAPGSLLAPMPGKVIRVDAAAGDTVTAGQPLLVLEAMKMEHEIVASIPGVVTELSVKVGDQVDTGTLLAAVEEEEAA